MPDTAKPHAVIQRARLQGIVDGNPHRYWQVGDGAVAHALTRHGLRWPVQSQTLATIALGLGELSARCHVRLWPLVLPKLTKLSMGHEDVIIAEAFEQTLATARSVSLADHGAAQLLSSDRLSWQLLRSAQALVARPWDVASTPRYGFQSVVRSALLCNPEAIARLVKNHRDHPLMASVVRAAVDHVQRAEPERLRAVAGTGIPLLVAMAAARVVAESPAEPSATASRFAFGRQLLIDSGVDSVDATCLMSLQLKEAVHQRFRHAQAVRELSHRLRWLEAQPQPLSPFDQNELVHLPAQLSKRRQEAEQHEKAFDCILDDVARYWPQDGLSPDRLAIVLPAFVDSEEVRYRLAMKLTTEPARAQILQLNLDAWMSEVGLNRPVSKVFDDDFSPRADDLFDQTLWAARSFIALHPQPKGGIGRQTSLVLGAMRKSADEVLGEPYMAARQPVRWQSALLRSSTLAIFALLVVHEVPAERRAETGKLAEFALDHAREVLMQGEVIAARWELADMLARLAIWRLAQDPVLHHKLCEWANCEGLPMLVRAMAAWSSTAYVQGQIESAGQLFVEAGWPPVSGHGAGRSFDQLMSLLDIAVATTAPLKVTSIEERLMGAWAEVIGAWPSEQSCWRDAPARLLKAVRGDGLERDALLANPAFQESLCRKLIESTG